MSQSVVPRDTTPRRRIWRWVLLAIVALLLWGVIFCLRVMYAEPVISVDYGEQIERLVRERQGMPEDAENGWDSVIQCVEAVRRLGEELVPGDGWTAGDPYIDVRLLYEPEVAIENDADRAAVVRRTEQFMAELRVRGILDEIDALRFIDFAVAPSPEGPLINWEMNELGGCRHIARINAARMYRASAVGDDSERAIALESGLSIARACARQGTILRYLVGVAIANHLLTELRRELVERPPTAEVSEELLGILDRFLPFDNLAAVLESERLAQLDFVQRVHSDQGGDGRLLITELNSIVPLGDSPLSSSWMARWADRKVSNIAGLYFARRAETTGRINTAFENLVRQSSMRPPVRGADAFSVADYLDDASTRFLVIKLGLPSLGTVFTSTDIHRLEVAGTKAMLAIERHRALSGEYPVGSQELTPPTIGIDPWFETPFGYRHLEPADDPDGRQYILYAIGRDRTDNAGKQFEDRYESLKSLKARGTDFVFNEPRPRKPDVEPTDEKQLEPPESPA